MTEEEIKPPVHYMDKDYKIIGSIEKAVWVEAAEIEDGHLVLNLYTAEDWKEYQKERG